MPDRAPAAEEAVLEDVASRWLALEERLAERIRARDWPGARAALAGIADLASAVPARPEAAPGPAGRWSVLQTLHDVNRAALEAWSQQVREALIETARLRESATPDAAKRPRWVDRTG